jgi:chromosome segregation ATPase
MAVVSGNDEDWPGKAEQLLQQQLKNVQEECRQLRESYSREGSTSRLSRSSRTNSTHSLVQGSKIQTAVSPPSLTPPHLTPHTFTPHTVSGHLTTPQTSNLPLTLGLASSASLSSQRSTHSELAPPTMTSSRHLQQRLSYNVPGKRGENLRTKKAGGKRNIPQTGHISTPRSEGKNYSSSRTLDNGYSSGGVAGGQGFNSGGVTTRPGKASGGDRSLYTLSSPLSLPTASTVSVPVTLTSLQLSGSVRTRREEDGGRGEERGRVRQLEHEVAVLEQQLSETTRTARSHVEELTCMRSELARERASLAREKQEVLESASVQLKREKACHKERCRDLLGQLERLRGEKREGDREIGSLRASLKGSQGEVARLSESLSRLGLQLERERESRASSSRSLHAAAEEQRSKVAALEEALGRCREEIATHISQLGELEAAHRSEINTLRNQVRDLEEVVSGLKLQLDKRSDEVVRLERELTSARTQSRDLLQEKTDGACRLEAQLRELERGNEEERGREKRRDEELRRSLEQSEGVRRSLLAQVERNGEELEKMTERLGTQQQREAEAERCRAEASQLHHLVGELQRDKREREAEVKESREEQRRLKVELGRTQAQLDSVKSQLQQARQREAEYSRATAELVKEAGQVRAESGRVKAELEVCRRELREMREEGRKKAESQMSSVSSLNQELASRTRQVLEMEELLRTQQTEAAARRTELEQSLAGCRGQLHSQSREADQLRQQLSLAQKRAEDLQRQVVQHEAVRRNSSAVTERQLSSKENEVAVLRRRLHSLQESHSTVLASSEALSATHSKAEAQVAEQLRVRQEELSRTRAQVSSLSIELTSEKKVSDDLRSQLTLARAEAARHRAHMQRAASLAPPPLTTGRTRPAAPPPSAARGSNATVSVSSTGKKPAVAAASHKKGHVIDL